MRHLIRRAKSSFQAVQIRQPMQCQFEQMLVRNCNLLTMTPDEIKTIVKNAWNSPAAKIRIDRITFGRMVVGVKTKKNNRFIITHNMLTKYAQDQKKINIATKEKQPDYLGLFIEQEMEDVHAFQWDYTKTPLCQIFADLYRAETWNTRKVTVQALQHVQVFIEIENDNDQPRFCHKKIFEKPFAYWIDKYTASEKIMLSTTNKSRKEMKHHVTTLMKNAEQTLEAPVLKRETTLFHCNTDNAFTYPQAEWKPSLKVAFPTQQYNPPATEEIPIYIRPPPQLHCTTLPPEIDNLIHEYRVCLSSKHKQFLATIKLVE